ncbi:hypothetical protein [Lacrimispora sp.]|uniref:hypothetical protein n=1 Tax=Lacrimispora sp. TaxID=2719234 RepID=UPI0028AD9BC2|nr:hypothetical protein [Lacrimispora sp.]
MNEIKALSQVDFPLVLSSIFIIFTGFKGILALLEWIADKTGLEFKWLRKKREDHELLMKTSSELVELRNQRNIDVEESIKHDVGIRSDLAELKTMFIDREIDTMRWEIINFSTIVSDGKPCNKDSYKHCLRTYEKYEKMLKDNHMTNGEVDLSMEIVNESYKEKLKNGF